jgi:hypothetical protein
MTDTALELVRKGVSLPDLLTAIVPARKTSTVVQPPAPKQVVRTDAVEAALTTLRALDLVQVDEVRRPDA